MDIWDTLGAGARTANSFFGDPFDPGNYNDTGFGTERSLVQQLINKGDEDMTAQEIIASQTDEKLGDDSGDVSNPEKQGFFQALLQALPGALGAAVARDPGQALIQVLQMRQNEEIQKERMKEERRQNEIRKNLEERGLVLREREASATERLADRRLDFDQHTQALIDERDRLRIEAQDKKTANDFLLANRELDVKVALALSNEANQMAITKANMAGNMAIARFRAVANANLQTNLQNMRSQADKEAWMRDSIRTLTWAGAGDPNAVLNAQNITNKMVTQGMDALTDEESMIVERAKNMNFNHDATRRALSDVAQAAAAAAMKPRYKYDDLGQQVSLPDRTPEEVQQFVKTQVEAYWNGMGVTDTFWMGENAETNLNMKYQSNFEKTKAYISELDPAEAWNMVQWSVQSGWITQEQANSLGLKKPNSPGGAGTGNSGGGGGAYENSFPPYPKTMQNSMKY